MKSNNLKYAAGAALLLLGGVVLMSRRSSAATKSSSSNSNNDRSDGGLDRGSTLAPPSVEETSKAGGILYDELVACYEDGQISVPSGNAPIEYATAVGEAVACLNDYYASIGVNLASLSGPQREAVNTLLAEVSTTFVEGLMQTATPPPRAGWAQRFSDVVAGLTSGGTAVPGIIIRRVIE